MPRPLPGGAGKNQASHSICSQPACSFTLVASACPGEDVAPEATSSKDSWAPGCWRPPPQPLALHLDDPLFPGCWEITGGEGLTGAHVELANHPGNSVSLLAERDSERSPACCCRLVTRLLVLDWLWGLRSALPATPPLNVPLMVLPCPSLWLSAPFLHLL